MLAPASNIRTLCLRTFAHDFTARPHTARVFTNAAISPVIARRSPIAPLSARRNGGAERHCRRSEPMSQPTLQKTMYMWRVWDRRADRLLRANHGPRHAQRFRAADMQPEDQGPALIRFVTMVEHYAPQVTRPLNSQFLEASASVFDCDRERDATFPSSVLPMVLPMR